MIDVLTAKYNNSSEPLFTGLFKCGLGKDDFCQFSTPATSAHSALSLSFFIQRANAACERERDRPLAEEEK